MTNIAPPNYTLAQLEARQAYNDGHELRLAAETGIAILAHAKKLQPDLPELSFQGAWGADCYLFHDVKGYRHVILGHWIPGSGEFETQAVLKEKRKNRKFNWLTNGQPLTNAQQLWHRSAREYGNDTDTRIVFPRINALIRKGTCWWDAK